MIAAVPSTFPIAGCPRMTRVCRRYSLFVSAHAIQCRNHCWSRTEKARFSSVSRAGIMFNTLFHPATAIDDSSE